MLKFLFLQTLILLLICTNYKLAADEIVEDQVVENSSEDSESDKVDEFVDFNLHHERLLKHGDHKYLKKYLEIPEPDVFLNADALGSRPIKMVNFSETILPHFNNWDEKTFTGVNYLSTFTFADLYSFEGVSKTNLNKFFEKFDPKDGNAINLKFPMPPFIREKLEIPSLLRCKYLEDKYDRLDMEILANINAFLPTKRSEFDQIICLVKGKVSMITLEDKFASKLNSIRSKTDKSSYKITEFQTPQIHAGECLFIPKSWQYSLASEYSWFYTISWDHIDMMIEEEWCNNSISNPKLASYKFKNDGFNNDEYKKTLGLILYFYLYNGNDFSKHITRDQFIEAFKNDKNLSLSILEWNNHNLELVYDIFNALDMNKDKTISLDDLNAINEDLAGKTVQKIMKSLQALQQIYVQQMKQTQELLQETMSKFKELELDVDSNDILKDRVAEAINKLPEDLKDKFKKENIDLNEFLMGELKKAFGKDEPKKRPNKEKVKPEKTKEENQEAEEKAEPPSESFVKIDEESVEEIIADNTETQEEENSNIKSEL